MSSNSGAGYVSTGKLPEPADVARLVEKAHALFNENRVGAVSSVYPALERVDPDQFGISLIGTSGKSVEIGDTCREFTIMSISKSFVFALICQLLDGEEAKLKLGAKATGLPFNSIAAIEQSADHRTNPMVNPGAIMTTSLVPGPTTDERRKFILDGLSRFAGRELSLNHEIYASATATNLQNREIVAMLDSHGCMYSDSAEALDLYTWQCSLNVTARDLAVMGATLAFGGTNPLTGEFVVDPITCHYTLAIMITAGLYETSGDWLYDIGLPGKSGIGGGIVTVSPGKGSLATFAPRLDSAGNSVKGQLVAKFLSHQLGLDLLASEPPMVSTETRTGTATASDSSTVGLRNSKNGPNVRYLQARLDQQSNLLIEGHDLGPATAPVSSDGEYEWEHKYQAADLPRLVTLLGGSSSDSILAVLQRNWTGSKSGGLERKLRESGIERTSWYYSG